MTDPTIEGHKGKKNIYKCTRCLGQVVTVDRDNGVTPFMIPCRDPSGCGGVMQSSFYQVPQDLEPTLEWFRPEDPQKYVDEKYRHRGPDVRDGMRQHIKLGGLDLREIENANPEAAVDVDEPVPIARDRHHEALVNDLAAVLNHHSAENRSNTPDFILAEMLVLALEVWDKTCERRELWSANREVGCDEVVSDALDKIEAAKAAIEGVYRDQEAVRLGLGRVTTPPVDPFVAISAALTAAEVTLRKLA